MKTKFLYFYLSFSFALISIFFPSHVSVAIALDIGEFINWMIGLYLYVPNVPIEEIRFNYRPNIGIGLLVCVLGLIWTLFSSIKRIKRHKKYSSRNIVILVISTLILELFYINSDLLRWRLFIAALDFSLIFALIGIYQVNEYLIKEGYKERDWSQKTQKLFGSLILTFSFGGLIYLIIIFFFFSNPYGITFIIDFYIQMFPIFLLLFLIFIFSVVYLKKGTAYPKFEII